MLPFLILLLLCIIISVIIAAFLHHRQNVHAQFLRAAKNIVQDEFLEYFLKNPDHIQGTAPPPRVRVMLFLQTNTNPPQKVVYDPAKKILVGRNPKECILYLSDPAVSQRHCGLYAQGNRVFVQDLGSANGTVLRRGLFKRYLLKNNCAAPLMDGDRICIGSIVLKVHLFMFDDARM